MATLVFVDDDPELAEAAATLATLIGHKTHAFTSAVHLIEELVEIAPDVIFSDLSMPTVHGCELARAVRAEPLLRGSLLVALTSFTDSGHRALAQRAGFDRYYVKPACPQLLQEAVALAENFRQKAGAR